VCSKLSIKGSIQSQEEKMKLKLHEPNEADVLHAILAGAHSLLVAKPAPRPWMALQAAFQIMCEELSIADKSTTVEVTFQRCMNRAPDSDGITSSAQLDPILMELKIQAGYELLPVLAHEMFHVRDLVTGVMSNGKDGVSLYHGKPVPKTKSFLTQADEVEAYEGMWALAVKTLDRLPPNIAKVFTKDYLDDIRPPTLREYYETRGVAQKARIEKAKAAQASQMTA
jgi:hypothetical protein